MGLVVLLCSTGEMMIDPNHESLQHFGVRLVAPLGGRLNQHWLVESEKSPRERLVLRRWSTYATSEDIAYELRLLARIAALGWPVACAVDGPVELYGHFWSLFPFLPGDPPSTKDPSEPRTRGRLLAAFHADLTSLCDVGQRGTWRRCEEILGDPELDRVLSNHEQAIPDEVYVIRWHLDKARARVAGMALHNRPSSIIHGDFTPWNLRFDAARLCGILDFELSHRDHRVGDFALSWRGKYDAVIHGYHEVAPLEPEEWAMITPVWWAGLIEGMCHDLKKGVRDEGWSLQKLLLRSPLMGPDAEAFRR